MDVSLEVWVIGRIKVLVGRVPFLINFEEIQVGKPIELDVHSLVWVYQILILYSIQEPEVQTPETCAKEQNLIILFDKTSFAFYNFRH